MENDFSGDGTLVGHYFINSGVTTDNSGEGNTLTPHNTPSSDGDYKVGSASCLFVKGDVEGFEIEDASLSSSHPFKSGNTPTFLICGWVKFTTITALDMIIGKFDAATGGRTFCLSPYYAGTQAATFVSGYNSCNSSTYSDVYGETWATDIWYHFGVWHNAADDSFGIRIWDDNASAFLDTVDNSLTGTLANTMTLCAQNFTIGMRYDYTSTLSGRLNEVVIFNALPGDTAAIEAKIDAIRAGTYSSGGAAYVPIFMRTYRNMRSA
ncbi:MAG: hypothetical protein PVG39_02020 [Desulfobacteraceae bacterium]|jgi:hypothetical protein